MWKYVKRILWSISKTLWNKHKQTIPILCQISASGTAISAMHSWENSWALLEVSLMGNDDAEGVVQVALWDSLCRSRRVYIQIVQTKSLKIDTQTYSDYLRLLLIVLTISWVQNNAVFALSPKIQDSNMSGVKMSITYGAVRVARNCESFENQFERLPGFLMALYDGWPLMTRDRYER